MTEAIELTFENAPALGPLYRRIFFARRPGLKPGEALPTMQAHWRGAAIDAGNVAAYCKACSAAETDYLPLLYPYVLTARLQVSMFANPAFPLKPMGMVHRGQYVVQQRPITLEESLDAHVAISASRVAKSGLEFDVSTVISSGGERVWESISAYWVRGRYGEAEAPSSLSSLEALENPEGLLEKEWNVPKGMGRHYASVSKDYNPIHISSLLAKLFGFRKAIIHGMWSAARCLAVLPDYTPQGPVRAAFLFKGPIYLGKNVTLKYQEKENAARFDLFCQGNTRPCLNGAVKRVDSTEKLVD